MLAQTERYDLEVMSFSFLARYYEVFFKICFPMTLVLDAPRP